MVKTLNRIQTDFKNHTLDSADAVALTLLAHCFNQSKSRILQGKRSSPLDEVQGPKINILDYIPEFGLDMDLWSLWRQYRVHKIQERIHWLLIQWKNKKINLKLTQEIPTPEEMLSIQATGARYITVFWNEDKIGRQVTDTKDDFHFTLHDLEHAERFLRENREGQITFFKKLKNWIQQESHQRFFKDPGFTKGFIYLMSDMNTHPEHQISYLEALLINWQKSSRKGQSLEPLDPTEDQWRRELLNFFKKTPQT